MTRILLSLNRTTTDEFESAALFPSVRPTIHTNPEKLLPENGTFRKCFPNRRNDDNDNHDNQGNPQVRARVFLSLVTGCFLFSIFSYLVGVGS